MANRIDALDEKLIKFLEQDARRSSEVLAKKLEVSPATVRRRVRVLLRRGVVRIAAIPNLEKIGIYLVAIVALKVEHGKLRGVMDALSRHNGVEWVCTTTGRFDMLLRAHFRATDELSRFVQKDLPVIEGIKDSETFLCLDSR